LTHDRVPESRTGRLAIRTVENPLRDGEHARDIASPE
jgi:hypothetical protein